MKLYFRMETTILRKCFSLILCLLALQVYMYLNNLNDLYVLYIYNIYTIYIYMCVCI